VPVEGVVDIEAERGRLSRELRRVEEELGRTEAKLAREDFRQRAPAEVVAREEARRTEQRALQDKLREGLERLDALAAR
jgi:valyl-tRNA synthetase